MPIGAVCCLMLYAIYYIHSKQYKFDVHFDQIIIEFCVEVRPSRRDDSIAIFLQNNIFRSLFKVIMAIRKRKQTHIVVCAFAQFI